MPRVCAGCRVPLDPSGPSAREIDSVLCGRCSGALQHFNRDVCGLCQLASPNATPQERCPRCASEDSSLDSCTAAVVFEGSTETWVRDFKYPRKGISGLLPGPESVMVALVCDAMAMLGHRDADTVVPMPLHPTRLRARGFNPANTLARAIAKHANYPIATDLLIRKRDTPTQTHLGRRQRRNNVRGAFESARTSAPTIWLIDDVVTTGSTLEEAARCLRRAGAKRIRAICAARTPQA